LHCALHHANLLLTSAVRVDLTLIIFSCKDWLFGHKRGEGTGNGEELSRFSVFHVIREINSRRMRWARHMARMGGRNAYRVLMGTPVGKRPL